jgi:hypothetical protein
LFALRFVKANPLSIGSTKSLISHPRILILNLNKIQQAILFAGLFIVKMISEHPTVGAADFIIDTQTLVQNDGNIMEWQISGLPNKLLSPYHD